MVVPDIGVASHTICTSQGEFTSSEGWVDIMMVTTFDNCVQHLHEVTVWRCLIPSGPAELCQNSEHQIKFQRKWAVSRPLVRLPVAPRCYIYCTLIVPGWRVSSQSNSCNFKHNLFLLWFSIIITNIHTKNVQTVHPLFMKVAEP